MSVSISILSVWVWANRSRMARGRSFARSSVQSAGGCREDWLNVGNLELISGLI